MSGHTVVHSIYINQNILRNSLSPVPVMRTLAVWQRASNTNVWEVGGGMIPPRAENLPVECSDLHQAEVSRQSLVWCYSGHTDMRNTSRRECLSDSDCLHQSEQQWSPWSCQTPASALMFSLYCGSELGNQNDDLNNIIRYWLNNSQLTRQKHTFHCNELWVSARVKVAWPQYYCSMSGYCSHW